MTNREDYLDSLLMSVSNTEEKEEAAAKDAERKSEKKEKDKPASPEDDFLKSFEDDFLGMDEDDFLREYEESFGEDEDDFSLDDPEESYVDTLERPEENEVDTLEEPEESFVDTLEDMMVDTMPKEETMGRGSLDEDQAFDQLMNQDPLADLTELLAAQTEAAAPPKEDPLMASLFPDENIPGPDAFDMEIPGMDTFDAGMPMAPAAAEEKPKAAGGNNAGPLFDDLDLDGVDFEVFGDTAPKEPAQSGEKDEDAELIDLLAGMSGDSDIAEITDMLKAHDSDQQMFGDEMTDLDFSGDEGDELGFLDDLQSGAPGKEKKKKPKKEKAKKEKPKKQPKEKKAGKDSSGGFKTKLARALFGDDDEDELEAGGTIDGINAENISAENRSILKEMDQEQPKKGKKKKEKKPPKEKKEKEKKPKKEKPPKPPKEKKEKEKKPKEKWEPIPVKPLILTALLGVSVVVLVVLGSNLLGYSSAVQSAEDAYSRGEYLEAYRELEGMGVKAGDRKLYDRVRTVAYMQKQLDFYEIYWKAGMYAEALDALIQALDRYDMYAADAAEAGASSEYEAMYTRVEQELFNNFSVMTEEARQIYASEDRKEYTVRLQELLRRIGLLTEE